MNNNVLVSDGGGSGRSGASAVSTTNQTVEQRIWSFFRGKGYTAAGTAGVMGNFQAESGLNPQNVQDGFGWSDSDYTKQVDSGSYSRERFQSDQMGYGLAQWTWWELKRDLYNFAKQRNTSIGNLDTQLNFAYNTIASTSGLEGILKSTNDIGTASDAVLTKYEKPAVYNYDIRRSYSYDFYNRYSGYTAVYNPSGDDPLYGVSEPTATDLAIEWALNQCDKGYTYSMQNRWGPTSYDCSAFIISAWNKAGVKTGASYTGDMAYYFTKSGFTNVPNKVDIITGNGLQAGDVLVWNKPGTSGAGGDGHTCMYIGDGQVVECTPLGIKTTNYYSRNVHGMDVHWQDVLRYKDPATGYSSGETEEESTQSAVEQWFIQGLSSLVESFTGTIDKWKSIISGIASKLDFDNDTDLNRKYSSYAEYVAAQRKLRSAGAVEENEPIRRVTIAETPTNISTQRSTGLLSVGTFVESPFIILKIGEYTFGTYGYRKTENTVRVTYPNYMQRVEVVKINGTVNQYTISMVYQIEPGQDPNLLDKIFSSVGYGTIKISYGDYSSPSFIFREEEAIITKLTSNIDFSSSRITYTLFCTSNALQLAARSYNFPGVVCKPSDKIIEVLFSEKYGLREIFTGMKNKTIARRLIAGDDRETRLEPKEGMNPLTYINYLVSEMSSAGEQTTSIGKSTYYLSIVDDVTNEYNGPYFKVVKVTADCTSEALNGSDVYEVDVGYSGYVGDTPNNYVMAFQVENEDSWNLLYKYSQEIPTENYVYSIDRQGRVITEYSPNTTTSSTFHRTTQAQKTWWTQMTQFPITAKLTLKGLLRPAMLMSYVRVNALFYGQRHVSSGLYIITKQQDIVDGNGYRTILSLTRVTGDNVLTFTSSDSTVSNSGQPWTGGSTTHYSSSGREHGGSSGSF